MGRSQAQFDVYGSIVGYRTPITVMKVEP